MAFDSVKDPIVGGTDLQRAGASRSEAIANPKPTPSTNVVERELLADQAEDAAEQKWEHVCDATEAAKAAYCKALEADPKADADKLFQTCLADLITVLQKVQDGTATNVFDQMAEDSTTKD